MKLNKKELRALAYGLSIDDTTAFAGSRRDWAAPSTDVEYKLRDLRAQVLKISSEEIGRNHSFLEIGGDSITAIHLVTAAQQAGILLAVAAIFADSQLSSIAAEARLS